MRTTISYTLLITLLAGTALWAQPSTSALLTPEPDSLASTSQTFIALQVGGNSYHNVTPSVAAMILFKISQRCWAGPSFEQLIGSFHDHYPAVWITNYTYPYEYGHEETTTGPTDANIDVSQTVIGITGLFLASPGDQSGCFYLGGGVGLYSGSLTRQPILTAPEIKHSFKTAIGFQLLTALRFSITDKLGIFLSAKYHLVHRELNISESNYVTYDYDAYGGVSRASRGDLSTYYSSKYSESGLLQQRTEIRDIDKLSGNYSNFAAHVGIFFKID